MRGWIPLFKWFVCIKKGCTFGLSVNGCTIVDVSRTVSSEGYWTIEDGKGTV